MLWITGERPVRVTAAGNRISTEGTSFRYLDFAAVTFEFASGLVGRVTANFGSVQPHQHVVRVFGTEATVVHDDRGPRLFENRDPDTPARSLDVASLPQTKGDLVSGFVAAVLDGGTPRSSVQHEFDLICACIAADRALAEGVPADIEYV
jgi:predicted dehydrogenase